jgi:putative component of toxin-antitoxin plasmid stabilization module
MGSEIIGAFIGEFKIQAGCGIREYIKQCTTCVMALTCFNIQEFCL